MIMKTGIDFIEVERLRQITIEGWTAAHDDRHDNQELLKAARSYELYACDNQPKTFTPPAQWPWESKWWKPCGPVRSLTKAGALYLAERDRMKRLYAPSEIIKTLENSVAFCARRIDELLVVK